MSKAKKFFNIIIIMLGFIFLLSSNAIAIFLPFMMGPEPDDLSPWWLVAEVVFICLEYAVFGTFAEDIGQFMANNS